MPVSRKTFFFAVTFAFFLFCERTTSPYLDNYDGDYRLEAEWVVPHDPFYVLSPYDVNYASIGNDSFLSFELKSDPPGALDTSHFRATLSDSSFSVLFTRPFTGDVVLRGIHPNYKETAIRLGARVSIPYSIHGPSRFPVGRPTEFRIAPVPDSSFTVRWFVDENTIDTSTTAAGFVFVGDTIGRYQVYALLSDTMGNSIFTDTMALECTAEKPTVQFTRSTLSVPIGKPLTVAVTAYSVEEITWNVLGLGLTSTTTEESLTIVFDSEGLDTITVYGKDSLGAYSDPDTMLVTVFNDKPHIDPPTLTPSVMLAGESVTIEVTAWARQGDIDSIHLKDDMTFDTLFAVDKRKRITTSVEIRYTDTGKYHISAAAHDGSGNWSEFVPATDSLIVNSGNPVVTGMSPDTVYMMDDTTYTIHATDPGTGGAVAQWFVKWNGEYTEYAESIVQHQFQMPGTYPVELYVTDGDGNTAEPFSDSVVVLRGKPTVQIVVRDSVWVHDELPVVLNAADTNGTVEQYAISRDGEDFISQADSLFTQAFSDAGEKSIRAYVVDEDGNSSDTVSATVTVMLGEPAIVSISTDSTMSRLYILDPITWTVRGDDPNGSVDSILVSWDGDTTFENRTAASGNSAAVVHSFARSDSGLVEILFRIIDNNGLVADTNLSVTILSGAPTVESIGPTETWINDDSTYQVTADDENGELIAWFLDTDNNGTWDDTSETGSFVTSFPVSGLQTVRYGVMDKDSQVTSATTEINVRLGKPKVWSPDGDTLFVVTPADGGDVTLTINSADSNGTIEKYYWDFTPSVLDTNVADHYKTITGSIDYIVPFIAVHQAQKMAVYVLDDDGLLEGDSLWLLPDAPPPAPSLFDGLSPDADSLVFKWGRKLDAYDSLQTKVQIAYCSGGDCTPTDSVYGSGSEPTIAEIEAQWGTSSIGATTANIVKFKKPAVMQSGASGRWRVILIDARGSRTPAPPSDPATFVAP